MLQQFKHTVSGLLPLSPFLMMLAAGLVVFLLLNVLLRRPPFSAWGLLAPLLLATCLEFIDIRNHYGTFLPVSANQPLLTILARHSLDMLTMLAIPLLLVIGRRWKHRSAGR